MADKDNDDDDIDEGFHFIEHLLCGSHYAELLTYKLCCNNPQGSYYDADCVNEKIETWFNKSKVRDKKKCWGQDLILAFSFFKPMATTLHIFS